MGLRLKSAGGVIVAWWKRDQKNKRGEQAAWETTVWKTKWESRIPESEDEWRERSEAFVEYLETRYDLPPRGEPATITRY